MSRLYIANCTRQNQLLYYRLDFTNEGQLDSFVKMPKAETIPAGRQVAIAGDLHRTQIDSIIEQLKVYGLVSMEDARNGRLNRSGTHPYVFSIDIPVTAHVMREVMAHNMGLSSKEGQLRRQRAAIATNNLVTHTVAEQFAANRIEAEPANAGPIEIEYEQQEQSEAGEKRIEEGYRISTDAPMPPKKGRGRRAA